jgi:hypothetical protein
VEKYFDLENDRPPLQAVDNGLHEVDEEHENMNIVRHENESICQPVNTVEAVTRVHSVKVDHILPDGMEVT